MITLLTPLRKLAVRVPLRSGFLGRHGLMTYSSSISRVALVTGASRGIGKAIAIQLARDGFDTALNDLDANKSDLDDLKSEITQLGRRAFVFTGDISAEKEVKTFVSSTVNALGSVDVMVANAGICFMKPIMDISVHEWDNIFNINVRGVFLCYKYAAEQMISQGRGGRIIGASSVAGQRGEPLISGYSATKFAIRGLTQAAAREWAKHGITVNSYAPGPIRTAMVNVITQASPDSKTTEVVNVENAVGHIGTPEDVAGLVSYLASDRSQYMTGQSVTIDGGLVFH